ncbi:DUF2637 domain-containing protein [Actinoallomurus acaciae]|uniref:DUF2637 domain-containing protein n=1 Tax=Actinoallomurus acaciae TaxID=502577 RepID=A0ABV5YYP6_9ACTN
MTDSEGERHGHPVRALGDGTGERAAVCLIGLAMLTLALIGMYVSFETVYEYVHPWFHDTAWAVPVAIDMAILVFSAADLLLSYWRMARPSMRLIPWGFTAATIWLNWQAGGPVPIRIAHAAMPALWVLFCEYARHVLAARVGLVNGARMERVRRSRWLLAPLSTARLRRRMILWEITSYRRALRLEAERHAELARMEMTYGRRWRRHAPAHERMAIRLAAVAPAELLPSLTRTIGTAPADRTAETAPAEAAPAEVTRAEMARTEATPAEVAPAEAEVTRPDPIPDLPPVEPKMGSPREPEPAASSEAARTRGSARERAVALLATEPDIPGTELARRLGVTTGYGRRLRSELLNTTNGYR